VAHARKKIIEPWMRDALRDGFQALQVGDTDKAGACCRRVLETRQDLPEAHFLVGLIALELEQRKIAIAAFGSVTKLEPEHGAAWAHLARLFMQTGQTLRADRALDKAVRHADDNPVVHDLIGHVHTMLGEEAEALKWYCRAVDAQPDNVPFLVNTANCQMYVGELEGSEATLQRALALSPGNPNAHWILAMLKRAKTREHVDEMQKLVANGRYPARARAFFHYGIGKELEDLEDWEGAFDAFDQGARARRSTLDFDEQAEVRMYEAFEQIYTGEWFDSTADGFASGAPIFVVGQPRTGTTLVERIITAHPDVTSAGELKQFGNALRRLSKYAEPHRFSAQLAEGAATVDMTKLGGMYIETSKKMAGDTPRFVDKLPLNFMYIPLILKALPNAKIVHLRRHPMDACFSSFKQLFADAYQHSYDQEEMARHHARYFRLMETWRERFGDRFLDIAYEDVARDLEPNARALLEYLELPWNDDCLNFHEQKTAVATASAVQVRKPAHTKSIGRWRRYESQLEPMRRTLESLGIPLET
jgi:tetratricopeptide (TPR) repeat protein